MRLLLLLFFFVGLIPFAEAGKQKSVLDQLKYHIKRSDALQHTKEDSSTWHARKAVELGEQCSDRDYYLEALITLIYRKREQNRMDSLLHWLNEARELAKEIDNGPGLGTVYLLEGNYHHWLGNHDRALELYMQATEVNKDINNRQLADKIANSLTTYYVSVGQWEKAEFYALDNIKALQNQDGSTDDPNSLARAFINLSSIYSMVGRFDEAESYQRDALNLVLIHGFEDLLPDVYYGLGIVFWYTGQLDSAKTYYDHSWNLLKDQDATIKGGDVANAIGGYWYYADQLDSAEAFYSRGIDIFKQTGYIKGLVDSEQGLTATFQKAENYKAALEHSELYSTYKDSLLNLEKQKEITRLEQLFEVERHKQRIALLEKDQEISRIWERSLMGGIGFLLVLSGVIGWNLRSRSRKNLQLAREMTAKKEAQEELTKTTQENAALREQQLKAELDMKNRQITSHALQMIQKNELMEELKEQAQVLKKNGSDESTASLNKLLTTVNYGFALDKDWEKFRLNFDQVHPQFFEQLQQKHQGLSVSDLRQCALLYLNMSLKESASILNIAPGSVKIARNRLKKKLDLGPEDSLSDYLKTY